MGLHIFHLGNARRQERVGPERRLCFVRIVFSDGDAKLAGVGKIFAFEGVCFSPGYAAYSSSSLLRSSGCA
jgi:hypothetical protein